MLFQKRGMRTKVDSYVFYYGSYLIFVSNKNHMVHHSYITLRLYVLNYNVHYTRDGVRYFKVLNIKLGIKT
jgi:hypothetical protein